MNAATKVLSLSVLGIASLLANSAQAQDRGFYGQQPPCGFQQPFGGCGQPGQFGPRWGQRGFGQPGNGGYQFGRPQYGRPGYGPTQPGFRQSYPGCGQNRPRW
jgi:hypothetical protein